MIINIISSLVSFIGGGITQSWWFEISQADATIILQSPTSLAFKTKNGTVLVTSIYQNSTGDPFLVLWNVFQHSNGLWYIGLLVSSDSFFTENTISEITTAEVTVTVITYTNLDIFSQPDQGDILAAYKPIYFQITATILSPTVINFIPPVVYCDIYFNDAYYKTVSKTQYLKITNNLPVYYFDIQDVLQEVLTYNLPLMDGNQAVNFNNTYRKVFVKFRNAKYDSNGFIVSEQAAPIQATSSNSSVEGLGLQSNVFYAYNATIQHEDNQNFVSLLSNFKSIVLSDHYYPLTRKPQYFYLGLNDSSYFPIISNVDINKLTINYKLINSNSSTYEQILVPSFVASKGVYYLPEGVPNIALKFPNIDFNNVSEYFLVYENSVSSTPIAGSRRIVLSGCKNDKKCRIHFINGFGEIDSINFFKPETIEEIKSDSWTKAKSPIFDRSKGGSYRQNITSNEIVEAECNQYGENDQFWIKELFETQMAWLEMQMPQGFNNSFTKEYVPIEILDSKFVLRKNEKRYDYAVKIKFVMSNSNINLRS